MKYLVQQLTEEQLKEIGRKGNVLHFTAECIVPVDFTGEVVSLDWIDPEWIFTIRCKKTGGGSSIINIGTLTYHLMVEVVGLQKPT